MINSAERLTKKPCKRKLLRAILEQPGASLFCLATDAGIPYATAHRNLMLMKDEGVITVQSFGPGRPLRIQIRERKPNQ